MLFVSIGSGMGLPKVVAKAKVSGPGYSLPAKSGKECARLCEKQPACDFANYDVKTSKCKVFSRCSPTLIVYNSTSHIHFAKRPIIKDAGYRYHPESDSCLKLIDELADYAGADSLCENQNGRLVSLSDNGINEMATELLRASGAQYAWVGVTDSRFEGNPLLTDGRRVSETGWFPVEKQSFRMDPTRNCWSLSDSGSWVEHSCKTRAQFSICQITPF